MERGRFGLLFWVVWRPAGDSWILRATNA
jgi:hypothetical protein